ncbi:MAG: CRISPR-associated protein Cas4 [Methanosarcinales archaeon]|uniref:CRISPR-associated exonuclease Cas4 n=1 Tax=Candidatus Ethanoperedens thermophilum TaxID=2766897 RepID=A0A848D828_9EURY|nr:CRISPR-associated protein Cas4 [Candidatus Ethanoperedens thermophilum]
MPGSESETIITISDVLEFLFCPRFIYFMHCLGIPQHEEMRYKVLKGRDVHEMRRTTNIDYARKKIDCMRKERQVFIAAKKHHIKGIVDEVLFLGDGTAAPLEYKFAEYKDRIFRTYKYQLTLQALMIAENYGVEVNRGYICYTRSNNVVKQIDLKKKDFDKSVEIIMDILEIIEKGFYPDRTKDTVKCVDCTYRNICV